MTGLPMWDRMLLRVVGWVVPGAERADWAREWQAELWHLRHGRRRVRGLSVGIVRDALWLRAESWTGTASLCLVGLAGMCAVAGIGLVEPGAEIGLELRRFGLQAPLLVLVTCATISRRHVQDGGSLTVVHRFRRQLFFVVKGSLVLTLAFLLSADFSHPLYAAFPLTADLMQILVAVLLSIGGLRWALLDQEERCKHCLVTLASAARVGRPSHNLLEWNGTEQACRHGHGRLSSPEMETSWCRHSRWVDLPPPPFPRKVFTNKDLGADFGVKS